jgi:hypothetical protein
MGKWVQWKTASKGNWQTNVEDGSDFPGIEKLYAGALMRIADALEQASKHGKTSERIVNNLLSQIAQLELINSKLNNQITVLLTRIVDLKKGIADLCPPPAAFVESPSPDSPSPSEPST